MNTTGYKYFISNINNKLLKNKKSEELYGWCKGWENMLIYDTLEKAFVNAFEEKVKELNEKYPRTAKLEVCFTRSRLSSPFLAVRTEKNYDATLAVSLREIKQEWLPN